MLDLVSGRNCSALTDKLKLKHRRDSQIYMYKQVVFLLFRFFLKLRAWYF